MDIINITTTNNNINNSNNRERKADVGLVHISKEVGAKKAGKDLHLFQCVGTMFKTYFSCLSVKKKRQIYSIEYQ
jgi:hypothetical protein